VITRFLCVLLCCFSLYLLYLIQIQITSNFCKILFVKWFLDLVYFFIATLFGARVNISGPRIHLSFVRRGESGGPQSTPST